MEDLNNHQIVLLTVFVSFVVSIATGIITVAMLEEAPPTLTQTVNRVVEHTIERVITGTSTTESKVPATVTNITKEVTVYAKEDDLVVSAVEKNQPKIARIYLSGSATSSDPKAIGFVISRDGMIVTATDALVGGEAPEERYRVLIGEEEFEAIPSGDQDFENQTVCFLKLTVVPENRVIDAVSYGRSEDLKLAQTVVVLGGGDGSGIRKTTIAKLRIANTASTSTPSQYISLVETYPTITDKNEGALVVNLDGQAVGMIVEDPTTTSKLVLYPIARILDLVGATKRPE